MTAILAALLAFIQKNRDLVRFAFATAFAARGRPAEIKCLEKAGRNFDFIESLIKKAPTAVALPSRFDGPELAAGIYGMMTFEVMGCRVRSRPKLSRPDAAVTVQLFFERRPA